MVVLYLRAPLTTPLVGLWDSSATPGGSSVHVAVALQADDATPALVVALRDSASVSITAGDATPAAAVSVRDSLSITFTAGDAAPAVVLDARDSTSITLQAGSATPAVILSARDSASISLAAGDATPAIAISVGTSAVTPVYQITLKARVKMPRVSTGYNNVPRGIVRMFEKVRNK